MASSLLVARAWRRVVFGWLALRRWSSADAWRLEGRSWTLWPQALLPVADAHRCDGLLGPALVASSALVDVLAQPSLELLLVPFTALAFRTRVGLNAGRERNFRRGGRGGRLNISPVILSVGPLINYWPAIIAGTTACAASGPWSEHHTRGPPPSCPTKGAAPYRRHNAPAPTGTATASEDDAPTRLLGRPDYHKRFPKSPTQTSGSFACHKCWAVAARRQEVHRADGVNDLRVLRCQKCDDGTAIAARFQGQWATFTTIMARADQRGAVGGAVPRNLDRVALELLSRGWRRRSARRSSGGRVPTGAPRLRIFMLSYPGDSADGPARDVWGKMDVPKLVALYVLGGVPRAGHRDGIGSGTSSGTDKCRRRSTWPLR